LVYVHHVFIASSVTAIGVRSGDLALTGWRGGSGNLESHFGSEPFDISQRRSPIEYVGRSLLGLKDVVRLR
jgi:hypothetical protein